MQCSSGIWDHKLANGRDPSLQAFQMARFATAECKRNPHVQAPYDESETGTRWSDLRALTGARLILDVCGEVQYRSGSMHTERQRSRNRFSLQQPVKLQLLFARISSTRPHVRA